MRDYKQTETGDLDFVSGDLQITESTYQHQRDLLLSDKGHIRDKAEAGVGAVGYLLSNEPEAFLRATRKEFAADGMKVRKVSFSTCGNDLETDASYENN